MSYICDRCGAEFYEFARYEEYRDNVGFPVYETMYGCPYCGSYDCYEIENSEDEED